MTSHLFASLGSVVFFVLLSLYYALWHTSNFSSFFLVYSPSPTHFYLAPTRSQSERTKRIIYGNNLFFLAWPCCHKPVSLFVPTIVYSLCFVVVWVSVCVSANIFRIFYICPLTHPLSHKKHTREDCDRIHGHRQPSVNKSCSALSLMTRLDSPTRKATMYNARWFTARSFCATWQWFVTCICTRKWRKEEMKKGRIHAVVDPLSHTHTHTQPLCYRYSSLCWCYLGKWSSPPFSAGVIRFFSSALQQVDGWVRYH